MYGYGTRKKFISALGSTLQYFEHYCIVLVNFIVPHSPIEYSLTDAILMDNLGIDGRILLKRTLKSIGGHELDSSGSV
jgi:hypothetical protein